MSQWDVFLGRRRLKRGEHAFAHLEGQEGGKFGWRDMIAEIKLMGGGSLEKLSWFQIRALLFVCLKRVLLTPGAPGTREWRRNGDPPDVSVG